RAGGAADWEVPRRCDPVLPARHNPMRRHGCPRPKKRASTTSHRNSSRMPYSRNGNLYDRPPRLTARRSEEHTSELQSRFDLVCRLLLEKKKKNINNKI